MPDREKVFDALRNCVTEPKCRDCPWEECERFDCKKVSVPANLLLDALKLLKEQEARVMTLDEVKSFDWDYCYLEEVRLSGKEYRAVCGDYALTCITWPYVTSMRIQRGDESYGKKWRCWTAKPTDEQRKAVKWE